MSANFKERPIDPSYFDVRDWYQLSDGEKIDCLATAMRERPNLIDKLYQEAFARGVDAFDYRGE